MRGDWMQACPKATKRELNDWIANRMGRMSKDQIHGLIFDEEAIPKSAGLFRPVGLPEASPRETADYRQWKAWTNFATEAHARAGIAFSRAGRYFAQAGTADPSREAMVSVVWFELNQKM